jgi:plasmid stabilization system protein ParE
LPQIVLTAGALAGIERCRNHLFARDPDAARRAASVIRNQLQVLSGAPMAGRPFPVTPELRELIIPFGRTGYVALYHRDIPSDRVLILAFRHQREAGY